MAVLLRLNQGGTTYSLVAGDVMTLGYTPRVGSPSTGSGGGSGGGESTVVDSIELLLYGATAAAVQTAAWTIERFLVAARKRQADGAGTRVYLEMWLDADSEYWRSEIIDGRLTFADGALDVQSTRKVAAVLILERVNFWESGESELPLSNKVSGAATGGRTIGNHTDGDAAASSGNWVQIAAGQVGGSLPTPALITLANATAASQDYRNLYLGLNAYSDPANFSHMIEGEAAAPSYGSSVSLGSCSGGAYLSKAVTGSSFIQWTLPAALLQMAQGRFFRLLARLATISGSCYLRPVIRDSTGLVDLFVGDERLVSSEVAILDLGALPLPPSLGAVSWGDLTLLLLVRSAVGVTVGVDFLQLTPADSFVQVRQRGLSIPVNGVITIDGIEGAVHGGGSPIYTPVQMPLWLQPNLLQRIYLLHDEGTGAPVITNVFTMRVYYRKRRLTL
ncbi:MAG: hypothetical protein DYG89_15245 [Caldilinea sp. CFX5]|nr:hypothetical protein [Caldilinea sp. CFX5]